MQEIPQSSYSNPSNKFNGKFFIGIPGLTSNYFSLSNSDFAYSDIITKDGDSLKLDFNNVLKLIDGDNYYSYNSKIDILSFGYTISPKTQFIFNVSENVSLKMNYTEDFVELIYKGNAGFDDNTANFEGIGINSIHYREYAFGLSHQLNEKLRLGVRLKYLYGMENIYTQRTDISLVTDPETFDLLFLADFSVKTSGIEEFKEFGRSPNDYLFGRNNHGLAIDFGGDFKINEKLSLNASVLDLGFIKWKDYTINYTNNGEAFNYEGIELNVFANEENPTDNGETSIDRVLDSMLKALKIDTTYDSYTTPLTGRFYIGANYKLNDQSMIGGVIQSEVFQKKIIPSITMSYNRKISKLFSVSGSYTIINRSFTNLGLGASYNPGPIQIYAVTDNIMGIFLPQHSRYIQFRFGINLIFGANKSTSLNPEYTLKEKKSKIKSEDESDSEKQELTL